jgi:DNA (cytosine-5)-methyltransferase 1
MDKQLTHGSLFAGIGGMDLGLERAGFKTLWQVEINDFCRQILEQHFPDAERFADIHHCGLSNLKRVDLISGGFSCQPHSVAGKQLGRADERWIWPEFKRIVRALRPDYVLLENVPGLLDSGFGEVLGDLAEIGYDAEWACIPASALGAPHSRERLIAIAYSAGIRRPGPWTLGNALYPAASSFGEATDVVDAFQRKALPFVCGRHDAFPHRLDQAALHALGNAVVPDVAEFFGRRILDVSREA